MYMFVIVALMHCIAVLASENISTYPFPKEIHGSNTVDFLKNAPILSSTCMRTHLQSIGKKADFYNQVLHVTLPHGVSAVFKPVQDDSDIKDALAEVIAYNASDLLGFGFVPPTVLRTIEGKTGSLQLYVKTDIDLLTSTRYCKDIFAQVPSDEKTNLAIFYFVLGQWDSYATNTLAVMRNNIPHLVAIDNSGIGNSQHCLGVNCRPFVRIYYSEALNTHDEDKPFPFNEARTVKNPTQERLRIVFGNTVQEDFYTYFGSEDVPSENRVFCYVIYRDSIWRQHQKKSCVHITHCPTATRNTLETLNLEMLKHIFKDVLTISPFDNDEFFQAILTRRSMVLQAAYDHF